jgi:hypothetical protein
VLLGVIIDRSTWDPERLRASRSRARLARSNAEASVERMLAEPESRRRIDPHLALGLLAAARRYALGALALHAQLAERPEQSRPDLTPLRDQIATALEDAANTLRRVIPSASARPPLDPPAHDPDIDVEIDMMADSVNTVSELISGRT